MIKHNLIMWSEKTHVNPTKLEAKYLMIYKNWCDRYAALFEAFIMQLVNYLII